jgi:hypothetical protein
MFDEVRGVIERKHLTMSSGSFRQKRLLLSHWRGLL